LYRIYPIWWNAEQTRSMSRQWSKDPHSKHSNTGSIFSEYGAQFTITRDIYFWTTNGSASPE
uniref:Capsid protein n=1 Tax=Haemonchus placei TaxID=6290 RepID=A0A158QR41_HAEPC